MAAPHSSSVTSSTHPPQYDQRNMFQLRIELFSFERATIEAQLLNYIEKIQRKHPTFQPDEYKMLPHHNVLQFNLPGENSEMPAFDYYEVQM